jgi:hypothetical protein
VLSLRDLAYYDCIGLRTRTELEIKLGAAGEVLKTVEAKDQTWLAVRPNTVGATTLDFACHFRIADPDAVLSGAIDIGGKHFVREANAKIDIESDPPKPGPQASARAAKVELQIAATHSADGAQAAVADFKHHHGNELLGLDVRIAPTTTKKGAPVFRVVVAGLSDKSQASALCTKLRSDGADCFVRSESGVRTAGH